MVEFVPDGNTDDEKAGKCSPGEATSSWLSMCKSSDSSTARNGHDVDQLAKARQQLSVNSLKLQQRVAINVKNKKRLSPYPNAI